MLRLTLFSTAALFGWFEGVTAQTAPDSTARPPHLCFHARPQASCSAFLLTNFGTYIVFGDRVSVREVADWGFMVNVGPRHAVGASIFESDDGLGFALGPAFHYRRWLSPATSWDVALGAPLMTFDSVETGSVFGLVRWSTSPWFAAAVRPELMHRTTASCTPTACTLATHSRARVSVGAEFGEAPGAVLTGLGAVVAIVALIVTLSSSND